MRGPRRHLALGLLWIVAGPGVAGTIKLEPGGQAYVDQLETEARVHTDALHSRLARADMADVRVNARALNEFRRQAGNYTVARFEYSYEVDGIPRTLILHGRSGKPLDTIATIGRSKMGGSRQPSFGAGEGSDDSGVVRPGSNAGSSSDESHAPRGRYEVTETELQRDINDSDFYPPDDSEAEPLRHVRTTLVRQGESDFEATVDGNYNRANDAELKNLRYLDKEIREHRVPRGGKLTGIVSKSPCVSCSENIDLFAETHDVNGTIRYLIEPPAGQGNAPARMTDIVAESRRSSDALREIRKAYNNQALGKETSWMTRRASWYGEPTPRDVFPGSVESSNLILSKELCE
ncbi:hypothetical protein P3W24_00100 [Luteibacter sp. PPL201]|uniref:Uncharacterized protein n=1 Tax=Luteibacter sahnii TaxID=3021977 RepID=A0ABT6B5G1_9GAMM